MPTMSPVRACQVIAQLLHSTHEPESPQPQAWKLGLSPEQLDAIRIVQRIACGAIIQGKPGTLRGPRG